SFVEFEHCGAQGQIAIVASPRGPTRDPPLFSIAAAHSGQIGLDATSAFGVRKTWGHHTQFRANFRDGRFGGIRHLPEPHPGNGWYTVAMARMARAVVPFLPHHITQRGNRRQQTFFGADDYLLYLALMGEWCDRHGVQIWAY